ncbi:MAG: sulfatase [Caldilineaceae bacterium]|nr:sulfatase [Caldilineaceae bacterium]
MNSPRIHRRTFIKGLSLATLAPLLSTERTGKASPVPATPDQENQIGPNVLFVVFDTLSAPHMSLYGYPRQTTPNLARFAERATVYHQHYAGGSFTVPGTASLLTGTYPWSHRAFNQGGTVAKPYEMQNLFSAFAAGGYTNIAYTHNLLANSLLHQFGAAIDLHLNPSAFCLGNGSFADTLFPGDADIATRSFDDLVLRRGGEMPSSLVLSLLDRVRMGLSKSRVMAQYHDSFPKGLPELFKLYFVLEQAIDGMIATVNAAVQPFLTYFHLLPPHEPYRPRKEFMGRFDDDWQPVAKPSRFFPEGHTDKELNQLRRHYDEFLAYADAEFGRLLDALTQSGRLDDTIVVFTSDHGQLFERGIHGHVTPTLYDPVVHIPLLIALPGQQARADVTVPTSCVDLLPTLLHLTGQPIPAWCEGTILPNFVEQPGSHEHSIYAVDAKRNPKLAPLQRATFSLRKGEYKLIHYRGYRESKSSYELYKLTTDQEEVDDLYEVEKAVAADLRHELDVQLGWANQRYAA